MSKADSLLKKATFFERMALYSDRKVFLQSLAQLGGASDAEIKAALDNVNSAAVQWTQQYGKRRVDAPGGEVAGRLFPDAIASQMTNLQTLSQSNQFDNQTLAQIQGILRQIGQFGDRSMDRDARMAWYGNVLPVITKADTIVQNTISKGGVGSVAPKEDDSGPMFPGMGLKQMDGRAVPEQEAPQTRPAAPPPINKADQAAVAAFYTNLVQTGDAMPGVNTDKMNDGVLGRETRKALEAIKDHFARKNPRNARMSDQDAIRAAKLPGNIR